MKKYQEYKLTNKPFLNWITFLTIVALLFHLLFPTLTFALEENIENTDAEILITESEVETGDALSAVTVDSEINTNIIDTNNITEENADLPSEDDLAEQDLETKTNLDIGTSTEDMFETASTTSTISTEYATGTTPVDQATNTTPTDYATSTPSKLLLDISATNTATSTNLATSTATTGHNTIEADNFTTNTGDAVAYVDLVNVVNTNIVNSTGLIDFIRGVLGYQNFDLRNTFFDIFDSLKTAESTLPCGENICDQASMFINMVNQANIYNNLSVTADTGSNQSEGGSGTINTGNAYASANLINVANTNIIDSNYLLLVFNNFSDMAGSLVLPNSDFFNTLFSQQQNLAGNFGFSNNVNINNNVESLANTGENSINGTGENIIETGNAVATSHTDNLINQNFLNSNSFSMLIRVHGNWSGEIFGLPEGMQWENTNGGIRLFYSPNGNNTDSNNSASVNITNDAQINNDVKVYALTGNNQINESHDSSINTGNAYADSTILNIANTNVVGSNWANLIFNIYGNWNGNLTFGQSDLWLGLKANVTSSDFISAGSPISYTYTIFNRGDVTAKDVILENQFPSEALVFADNRLQSLSEGKNKLSLGDIKAGETKEITINAKINDNFAKRDRLPVPLSAKVYGAEPDANHEDNEDSLMIYAGKFRGGSSTPSPAYFKTPEGKLILEKTADKNQASAGETINYTLKLINKGGVIYDSLLVDVLKDEGGNILLEQTWPLDNIKNDETITVTYSITVPESVLSDTYTNTAQLVGMHGSKKSAYRTPFESSIVQHTLLIGETIQEFPMTNASISTCTPYLTTYLRQHRNNDDKEVIKLQEFLKLHVDDKVIISALFDDQTRIAVDKFQQQYAEDILHPWGMTQSSGYVYYTTQKKINEIMCGNLIEFPLTIDQEKEIDYFKTKKDYTDSSDWLFSSIKPITDTTLVSDTTEESGNSSETQNNVTFLKLNFPTNRNIVFYERLDNWLYLFKNTRTAYIHNPSNQ